MYPPLKDLQETVEAFSFILERTQQRTDVFPDAMDATEETMLQLQEETDKALTAAGCGPDSWSPWPVHTSAVRCELWSRSLKFHLPQSVGHSRQAI